MVSMPCSRQGLGLGDAQRFFQAKPLWDSSLSQLLCDPCMEITAAHLEAASVLCFAWGAQLQKEQDGGRVFCWLVSFFP